MTAAATIAASIASSAGNSTPALIRPSDKMPGTAINSTNGW